VPLRIGISIDFPALGMVRDNPDVVMGFGVELSNLLLDDKGIRHRFHGAPLPELFGPLVKGDFDLVISQLPINPEDAKVVNFSDPYFVFRHLPSARLIKTGFRRWLTCAARLSASRRVSRALR
jgi:ABC-type amino acid transport substrate-binding protein